MVDLWKELSAGSNPPEEVNLVVEIPKGSKNKYEYDKELGVIRLDRVLHDPFRYGWDYGLVPKTLAGDGDPADGLVLMDDSTFPGCVIPVRPIGIMHMVDQGEEDEKIIFVALKDPSTKDIKDIRDLPKKTLDEIKEWFSNYKKKENKVVEVSGFDGADKAKAFILQSIELYSKNHRE